MLLMHTDSAVVGASAGAFGLTAAFAVLFPDSVIMLFFILPLPAKFLLLISGGLAIGGILFPDSNFFGRDIAHAAHLGGIVTGILFIRYAVHWRIRWPKLQRTGTRPARRLVKVHSQKPGMWGQVRADAEEDLPAAEFLTKEVDPILDKISAHGIQSLTERERKILETARAKIDRKSTRLNSSHIP